LEERNLAPKEDRIGKHIEEELCAALEVYKSVAMEEVRSKQVTNLHMIAAMMAQNTFEAFPLRCNSYQMETWMAAVFHIHFLIIIDFGILPMDPYSFFKNCIVLNIMDHHCYDL
jgi:hypothetical protein